MALSYHNSTFSDKNGANVTSEVTSLLDTHPQQTADAALGKLYRSSYSSADSTADSMLLGLGVIDARAAQFFRSNALTRDDLLGTSGRLLLAQANSNDSSLDKLTVLWSPKNSRYYKKLVIKKTSIGGFTATLEKGILTVGTQMASGVVNSTFYEATAAARIPMSAAAQIPRIFTNTVDVQRNLRNGARFSLIYETLEGDGQPLRTGRVLGAEIINNGVAHHAIWFSPKSGKGAKGSHEVALGGYYSLSGENLTNTHQFLSSPVRYARVSSPFGKRFDPYLHKWHVHEGVDLAAAMGSPIETVGNGVIVFAGAQTGYGNTVIVRHDGGISTLYAHMSKIKVHVGERVAKGKVIGLIGESGWATGPHVHFEFRVNGVRKNPLVAMAKFSGPSLALADRSVFLRQARIMKNQLNQSVAMATDAPII
jgi:murein DD-endopeptidase MepM/ murein hydrolase activator NlpD